MLGSLSCLSIMIGGGSSFPSIKSILCVQSIERNCRSKDNCVTVLRITIDWRLLSWGGSRLEANINLDRSRKGCVCVEVCSIVAVMEATLVSNKQVD